MAIKLVRKKNAAPEPVKTKAAKPGVRATGGKIEKVKDGSKSRDAAPGKGRYVGATTGLGVTKFQNKTIEDNRKKRMTDEELAALWRKEFPNARAEYTAETVRSVRNVYNLGKHGNDKPAKPVPEFDDSGQPLPAWGEKAEAKREQTEDRARVKKLEKKTKK